MQPPKAKARVVKRISLPIVLQRVVRLQRKAEKKEETSGSKAGNLRAHKRTRNREGLGLGTAIKKYEQKIPSSIISRSL